MGWNDGRIALYDLATGEQTSSLAGNARAVALSPDGQRLALVSSGGAVELHPIERHGPAVTMARPHGWVGYLAFSPDGTILGGTLSDQTAVLWDVAGRKEPLILRGHKENVSKLAFSPDGEWVATTSNDYTTRIWDVHNGQVLAVVPGPWFMDAVAFSPDGNYLAISAMVNARTVSLYQLRGRREGRRLVGHTFGTQSLAFHPRLAWLATGADDCDIIVWDLGAGRPLRQWRTAETWVAALAFSPDGSLLASGNGNMWDDSLFDYPVAIWDAATGARRALHGQPKGVATLAFDRSGRRVASSGQDGTLIVWDVATGSVLRRETIGSGSAVSIAFLGDGRHLVGSVTGQVALVDLEGKEPTRRVGLPHGWGRFVVDAGRSHLIVGGADGALCAMSLPGLSLGQERPKTHDGSVWSLALSPDGRILATGGEDRRVVLHDPETFEPWLTFPEWTGVVKELAFDHSGSTLAFVGADSDVAVWDLKRVHDDLSALGLAWDQPAPTVAGDSGNVSEDEHARSAVPVIQPRNTDPVAYEIARGLVQSGASAFENGRLDEAIRDLEQARDRLKTLIQAAPGDRRAASSLALSLGFLGSAHRDKHQPAEALSSLQEARRVLENVLQPAAMDLYNLACTYAGLSTLAESGPSPPTSAKRENLADRAMEALGRALAAGMTDYALMDRDHDLDPLRERPDFRALILDRGFPSNPLASAALAGAGPSQTAPAQPSQTPPDAPRATVGLA